MTDAPSPNNRRGRVDVVGAVKGFIRQAGIEEQGRLPPERELAVTLGLDRKSVV